MEKYLRPPEPFNSSNEDGIVAIKWQTWKRALEIYLEVTNIKESKTKLSLLLHCGGQELQEIIYNIPGAIVDGDLEGNKDVDIFQVAIEKLNNYFSPKLSRIYERHVFRQIRQRKDERFDQFLIRLRKQAEKCQFLNQEHDIIGQVAGGCDSEKLRRKLLELDDRKTLDDIILIANTLENVNKQMINFDNNLDNKSINVEVNKINFRARSDCSRCGKGNHTATDENCPAKNKSCYNCGF